MQPRREQTKRSSAQFGLSFIDGEKLSTRTFQKAAGGMASTAWAVPAEPPQIQRQSSHEKINYRLGNIQSLQKRGAAKLVIPGDLTKPTFLKQILGYVNKELRFLGATK